MSTIILKLLAIRVLDDHFLCDLRSDHFMRNEPDPYQIICQKCEPDQINDLDQINFQITPNIKILN